jgi:hypothetical protein
MCLRGMMKDKSQEAVGRYVLLILAGLALRE